MPKRSSSHQQIVEEEPKASVVPQQYSGEELMEEAAEDGFLAEAPNKRTLIAVNGKKLMAFFISLAPVFIVMYLFGVLRSEMTRMQSRMDAIAMKFAQMKSSRPNPFDEFQSFVNRVQQEPGSAPAQALPAVPSSLPTEPVPVPPVSTSPPEHIVGSMPPYSSMIARPPSSPAAAMIVSQLVPQIQPEGVKKSLPRVEEIDESVPPSTPMMKPMPPTSIVAAPPTQQPVPPPIA